jgi:hypothetical protein
LRHPEWANPGLLFEKSSRANRLYAFPHLAPQWSIIMGRAQTGTQQEDNRECARIIANKK